MGVPVHAHLRADLSSKHALDCDVFADLAMCASSSTILYHSIWLSGWLMFCLPRSDARVWYVVTIRSKSCASCLGSLIRFWPWYMWMRRVLLPSSLDRASSIHWPTRLTAHTTSVAVDRYFLGCLSSMAWPELSVSTLMPRSSLGDEQTIAAGSPFLTQSLGAGLASTSPRTSTVLPRPISSQMKPPLGIAGTWFLFMVKRNMGENRMLGNPGMGFHITSRRPPGLPSSSIMRWRDCSW